MFNNLFCNHEFVYVDKELITHFPEEDEYLFKFMCKKCKKKKYISSLYVEKIYDRFVRDLNEMVVIDGFIDTSEPAFDLPTRYGSFHMDTRLTGYAADKTIEYFKNKYSIDITQIRNDF
ncbi:hypothetical protein [uncultured Thomasclavelia sp.]|uniref:hypothetical protein n=1 Tax=uncultured Thomasclavelia sp. TaxID=3025759 RepID=UPI002637EAEC|nr:hypothetical protein [uncultured Thomasclavelia sp.]